MKFQVGIKVADPHEVKENHKSIAIA